MDQWDFKAAKIVGPSKTELVELSLEQQKRIHAYENAIIVARDSNVPNPPFSNYFVKGSIGTPQPTPWSFVHPAGNIEYGICQALHCEETAVAIFLAAYNGKKVPDKENNPILGFCSKNEVFNPPTCCGNCRDILLDTFGPELEIVSGRPNGGIAIVSKLGDLLWEKFQETSWGYENLYSFTRLLEKIEKQARGLTFDPHSPDNVHPERRYHVYLRCKKGEYVGTRDILCDYHPIYAGRDAARQAVRNFDPFIDYVVVVCKLSEHMSSNALPHVMYKDRQHLLETNLQAELVTGQEKDPNVYLFTYKTGKNMEIVGSWKTTLKTWLPFPFSPRNFGKEFVKSLTKYCKDRQELGKQTGI